jgi:hypothetical protein
MKNKLYKCLDCEKEVSKTAKVCPNCGNKKLRQQIQAQQWAEMDPKKKYIIIGVIVAIVAFAVFSSEDGGFKYENGKGTITHYTEDDWDIDASTVKMYEEVWEFCQNHPEAKKIDLVIVDGCKDTYGNKSERSQTIVFNKGDIKTFLEYKTASSFKKNCYEFGTAILEWKPCGNSQYDF